MGLLRKLLLAPVTAPLDGALWVTMKVAEAAEQEFLDPAAIRRQLDQLERALDRGEIDEDTYDTLEDALMTRLAMAAERPA